MIIFIIFRTAAASSEHRKHYRLDRYLDDRGRAEAVVTGTLKTFSEKSSGAGGYKFFLKNVNIVIKDKSGDIRQKLKNIIVYGNTLPDAGISVPEDKLLYPGNRLLFRGYLKGFEHARNPGNFDAALYYEEKGIYYCFEAEEAENIQKWRSITGTAAFRLRRTFHQVFEKVLDKNDASLMCGMILGEKDFIDPDTKTLYKDSGTFHLVCVSGLHLHLINSCLMTILLFLKIPKKRAALINIVLILFYTVLTDFSVSTSRACIMIIMSLISSVIGRSSDIITSLAVSAFIILAKEPYQIFTAGFQLSFLSILGIVIMNPVLSGFKENILFICSKASTAEGDTSALNMINKRPVRSHRILLPDNMSSGSRLGKNPSALQTSISIQFFTLPVILFFFYGFPLYSVVLNLIVIPAAGILVPSGFICCITGAVIMAFPLSGAVQDVLFVVPEFFGGTVHYILKFYEIIMKGTSKLPCSTVITGCPELRKIFLYYFLLLAVVIIFKMSGMNRHKISEKLKTDSKKFKIFSDICMLILCVSALFLFRPAPPDDLTVTFIDVGQGDSILVRTPAGSNILIDCGSVTEKNVGTYRAVPFFKHEGVVTIDHMIMTHADEDHISGLKEIMNMNGRGGVRIKELVMPDTGLRDDAYKSMTETAEKNNINVRYISAGMSIISGKAVFTCLNPEKGFTPEDRNPYSAVFSLEYGKTHMLLTGDLSGSGEEYVLEKLNEKKYALPDRYDLLKVAHHGSRLCSSPEFLERTAPDFSIISAGKNNTYGHPSPELIKRLKSLRRCTTSIFTTINCGAVTAETDGKNINVSSFLKE